jgi:hypothetical protein
MLGFSDAPGYWVATSTSHPDFHRQGVIEPCIDVATLYDAAKKACLEQGAVPPDTQLEVRKYSPPKGWRK